MRKILSVFIVIVLLLLSLVACDSHNDIGNDNNGNNYEWEQLEWPTYDNAKQIPIPKSATADVRNNNDIRFDFYLADTTYEDYKSYVEECKTKGFTIDAAEQENRYSAFNKGKYELTVQYYDGDIMYVEIVEDRCEVEIKLLHTSKDSAKNYSVRIEIDGYWEEDGEKGKEAITFDSYLKEGNHTLIIENDDDDDINGRIDFVVTEDGEYFEFEITCLSNKIDIEQITGNESSEEDTNNTEQSINNDENSTKEDNVLINSSSTNSYTSNTHYCEATGCTRKGTKTYKGISSRTEYYCETHYKQLIDIMSDMEEDVGKGQYSKHICEECSREGTYSIIGISGKTEYYCSTHYSELKEFMEIFQ